jgi:hypothetical protein
MRSCVPASILISAKMKCLLHIIMHGRRSAPQQSTAPGTVTKWLIFEFLKWLLPHELADLNLDSDAPCGSIVRGIVRPRVEFWRSDYKKLRGE